MTHQRTINKLQARIDALREENEQLKARLSHRTTEAILLLEQIIDLKALCADAPSENSGLPTKKGNG